MDGSLGDSRVSDSCVGPGPAPDEFLAKVYAPLIVNAKHTVVNPGDKIPLGGVDIIVVASAGAMLKTPLLGGGIANPACASFQRGQSNVEDMMSVGTAGHHDAKRRRY